MNTKQQPLDDVAIRFLSGPLAGKSFSLQQQVTTIGRDKQNAIVVSDQRVSRHHARFIIWMVHGLLRIFHKEALLLSTSNVQSRVYSSTTVS